MTLTFKQLRETNVARCNRWHSLHSWSGSDWGVALAGEVGEACNVIKKMNRERDGLKGKYATVEDLAEELADAAMYLDLLAASYDIDLEDHIRRKFNKVSIEMNFPERL